MNTWNRLTAVRGERGGGTWMKEGEGIGQRTLTGPIGVDRCVVMAQGEGRGKAGWRWAKRRVEGVE